MVNAPIEASTMSPFMPCTTAGALSSRTREVSVTPSASLLLRCLAAPVISPNYALLIGRADDFAPRVADEVATIAPAALSRSTTLVGDDATRSQLQHHAPSADLLHIACHGRFRSDNPLLRCISPTARMIVRDAYELHLRCMLVTLAAHVRPASARWRPATIWWGSHRGFLLAERAHAARVVVDRGQRRHG